MHAHTRTLETPQRGADNTLGAEASPAKVPHVEPKHFIEVANIPGSKLLSADLANIPKAIIGNITLQVFTGQTLFLVNIGDTAIELPAGHAVAGFGAGSFQHKPMTDYIYSQPLHPMHQSFRFTLPLASTVRCMWPPMLH